jgi:ABC-type lipoprotein export system ATPase subunit
VEKLLSEFKERILVFVTHDAFVMAKVNEVIDLSSHPALELSIVDVQS